ncbi:hypothetical protein VTN96DRAFT_5931 [Rasamsonia emersonii]|uniref:Uncharacterized protein n=1 Tax=Rasamsonia emersonii (strain ATCC 16479 / CBS 393.64 / IMI 116815) TaxID=1408163 RepID=A0A0F4Z668_RASE3|nr:hypothetical protein T310_0396 [Rasamsonia emersonii CBS 393.64]KKA25591.1 hypothetical protein T310_0396 [Rasamsonia emersonii CBS 393.64]
MASRRPHQSQQISSSSSSTEKETSLAAGAAKTATKDSDVTPAVSTGVILKLLGFTVAMIVAPIGMYFLTIDTVFKGNSTFAGAGAALTANVVLIAYIVVAWREDQEEEQRRKEKKTQ